jgi:hypothetical protein
MHLTCNLLRIINARTAPRWLPIARRARLLVQKAIGGTNRRLIGSFFTAELIGRTLFFAK